MKGRKPKPTALKIAQGNPGHERLDPSKEPQPDVRIPDVPEYLSPGGATVWKKLAPMLLRIKVLTEAEMIALGRLCELTSQLEIASKDVATRGVMIDKPIHDRDGNAVGMIPALNPMFKVQTALEFQVKSYLVEFGLTPSSRSKVTKKVDGEKLTRDPLQALRDRAKRTG